MTSSSRTARCGPACRVVWQGWLRKSQPPYADLFSSPTWSLTPGKSGRAWLWVEGPGLPCISPGQAKMDLAFGGVSRLEQHRAKGLGVAVIVGRNTAETLKMSKHQSRFDVCAMNL
jgi:hypothetical protein